MKKLLRCEKGLQELQRVFVPQIPYSAPEAEDKTTRRVCLGESIDGCLSAMPDTGDWVEPGTELTVYEVNLPINMYLPPEYLYRKYGVQDALYTREHWSLVPIEMKGAHYRIESFESENYWIPDLNKEVAVRNFLQGKAEVSGLSLDEILNRYIPSHEMELGLDEDDIAEMFQIKGARMLCKVKLVRWL